MPTLQEQFQPELDEIEKEQARQPGRMDSKKMLSSLTSRSIKAEKEEDDVGPSSREVYAEKARRSKASRKSKAQPGQSPA